MGQFIWKHLRFEELHTYWKNCIKPLNAKLNPICHLLVLLGAHHILHVSGIRVKINENWDKLNKTMTGHTWRDNSYLIYTVSELRSIQILIWHSEWAIFRNWSFVSLNNCRFAVSQEIITARLWIVNSKTIDHELYAQTLPDLRENSVMTNRS
jgi:hypothetical protein